uniref:RPAP1_N domain-containing protein n=1 Tax=Macrostomum lignano TaxID=282301 RepID=A0A1I8FQ76_9PLAT
LRGRHISARIQARRNPESSGKSPPPPVASWAAVAAPPTSGLASVMSEQLATTSGEQQAPPGLRLAAKLPGSGTKSRFKAAMVKKVGWQKTSTRVSREFESAAGQGGESDSDFVLALMLQQEFDGEFDRQVRLSEAKLNGNQKVRGDAVQPPAPGHDGAPASDSRRDPAATTVEPPLLPPGPARSFNSPRRLRPAARPADEATTRDPAAGATRTRMAHGAASGTPASAPGDTDGLQLDKPRALQQPEGGSGTASSKLSQQEQLEQQRRQQLTRRPAGLLQRLCDNPAPLGGGRRARSTPAADSNSRCKGGRPMPPDVVGQGLPRGSRSRALLRGSAAGDVRGRLSESQLEPRAARARLPTRRACAELRGLRRLRRRGVASRGAPH